MSGRLKAQYNRVRTSTTLQGNAMWNTTIGQEQQGGHNAIIEASLNAPGGAPGGGRAARQAAAQNIVTQTGGFGGPEVKNYESLLTLARSQGAVSGLNRGACKVCGQLGHLTKQCRNHLSSFYDSGAKDARAAGAQLLAAVAVEDQPSDLSSDASSSSSSEDEGARQRKERRKAEKAEARAAAKKARRKARKKRAHDKERKGANEKEERSKKSSKGSRKRKRRASSSSGSESE